MVVAARKIYEAEEFGILRELWDEFEQGNERRWFLQNSGFDIMLQNPKGTRDLFRLIADEFEGDRKTILTHFASMSLGRGIGCR